MRKLVNGVGAPGECRRATITYEVGPCQWPQAVSFRGAHTAVRWQVSGGFDRPLPLPFPYLSGKMTCERRRVDGSDRKREVAG